VRSFGRGYFYFCGFVAAVTYKFGVLDRIDPLLGVSFGAAE
jgi:hypothetical protein